MNTKERQLLELIQEVERGKCQSVNDAVKNLSLTEQDVEFVSGELKKIAGLKTEQSIELMSILLDYVMYFPKPKCVAEVVSLYPSLDGSSLLQGRALRVLSQAGTEESLTAFANILVTSHPDLGDWVRHVFIPIHRWSKLSGCLFPALFSLIDDQIYRPYVLRTASTFLERGDLKTSIILKHKSSLLKLFRFLSYGRYTGECAWEACTSLEHLTSIVSVFSPATPDVLKTLRTMINDADCRLAAAAALTLVKLKHEPSIEQMELLTDNASVLQRLYSGLKRLNRLDLIPEEKRSQTQLAKADLSYWLEYPAELGHPPDEIEVVGMVEKNKNKERVYLLKFRSETSGNKWMAGISGTWMGSSDVRKPSGTTFSHFNSFDELSLSKHFATFGIKGKVTPMTENRNES